MRGLWFNPPQGFTFFLLDLGFLHKFFYTHENWINSHYLLKTHEGGDDKL